MDYGEILTQAWRITWRRKSLWVLGLLAGCSASGRGSGGGQAGSSFRGYDFNGGGGAPEIERFFESIPPEVWISAVIGIVLIILALALVSLVLGVLGQSGLISAFAQEDAGVEVPLGRAFSLGGEYFWRLLGVRLVVWLIGIAIAGAVAIFAIFTLGVGLLCLAPLLCLLIPVSFLVDAYVVLTMVAAVQEDLGVLAAFSRAWEVIRSDFAPVLVMALILILGGGIVNLLISAPFVAVFVPGIVGLALGEGWTVVTGLVASGALLLIALPLLLLASAIITTFTTGAWTITYRRLIGEGGIHLEAAGEPA
jgi:hypothetical protein